jgi:hypothetical protein
LKRLKSNQSNESTKRPKLEEQKLKKNNTSNQSFGMKDSQIGSIHEDSVKQIREKLEKEYFEKMQEGRRMRKDQD